MKKDLISPVEDLEREIRDAKGPVTVPDSLKEWLGSEKRNFIAGDWAAGRESFPTINPATGEILSSIPIADRAQVDTAVRYAREFFEAGEWSRRPLVERAAVVRRIGDLILEHRAPLAMLETLDSGKPIRESFEGDVLRAAKNFHFFAELITGSSTGHFESGNEIHFSRREPLGVAVLITPWNLPLYLETWKLAPCLLMGNSTILKPSELTPLTAIYLRELCVEAGLPAGAFQLLNGLGENSTGEFLTANPGIDAISFTGETGTGRAIMRAASVGPTRVSFELGGKGAMVVFDDADIERAASEAVRAAFRNQGEICLACPRLYVHERIYSAFRKVFLEKVAQIRVGDPLDSRTTMGALISTDHWNKVTGYLRSVRITTGGSRPAGLEKGNFLSPTVIEDATENDRVTQEEIFGPVVCLYPFSSESEVVRTVNATPYGLSASVWTQDMDRALRVSNSIRAGLIWVNSWFVRDLRVPFGGQKKSGVGREGGYHSLDFFSEWKSVCLSYRGGI